MDTAPIRPSCTIFRPSARPNQAAEATATHHKVDSDTYQLTLYTENALDDTTTLSLIAAYGFNDRLFTENFLRRAGRECYSELVKIA